MTEVGVSFNSFAFVYFFVVVYAVYLVLRRASWRWQNLWLLGASFFFYGCWGWRFLLLLLITVSIDYLGAMLISQSNQPLVRRFFLCLSITANLGVLLAFKYLDFFALQVENLSSIFGCPLTLPHRQLFLPVGLSFYTFQAIAYVADVYRRRIQVEKNPCDFFLFITFFPQLVAGPIERAKRLLPQIKGPRQIRGVDVTTGVQLTLYGFFKKLVVADNLSPFVQAHATSVGDLNGSSLYLLMLAMITLIYADFSGYSDIARGLGRLLGFDLSVNFKQALFAGSPADFWRRWHLTLTQWFRDYLFWPLLRLRRAGTNPAQHSTLYVGSCIFCCFVLSGLWHGAAWNFIFFGAYHGLLLLVYHAGRSLTRRFAQRRRWPAKLWTGLRHIVFFHLLSASAVMFFVRQPREWLVILWRFANPGWGETLPFLSVTLLLVALPLLVIDGAIEWQSEAEILDLRRLWQWGLAVLLLAGILLCGAPEVNEFTYFQF